MDEKRKTFNQIQREESLKYLALCEEEFAQVSPAANVFDYIQKVKCGNKNFYAHCAKKAGHPIIKQGGKFYIEI